MKDTRIIMGMPITIEIAESAKAEDLEEMFAYFTEIDERFSTYKENSEIMQINRGEIEKESYSPEMREVLALAEKTKKETGGYFDIAQPDGQRDPSGIVKGWAIRNAANFLKAKKYKNFFVDAGGDIQSRGVSQDGMPWSVGIRNPFNREEIIKVVYPNGAGIATSGSYVRGHHIYNPLAQDEKLEDVVSLTVIAPDVLEADRLATAAFAMGTHGIQFIESYPTCEGYSIDASGIATMTSGFEQYMLSTAAIPA